MQLKPASPVLNLAKKEWTASKFEMDGLLCRIGPTPAQGELRVALGQISVLQHV
jgi:hypothetical protein